MVDLIYCADGNKRLAQIAVDAGFLYGARLPGTIYPEVAPLTFADQDWKKPNRGLYMNALANYRPQMATVIDLESWEQLPDVISWAEEAAQYVEIVIIIPKRTGIIPALPKAIAGKEVRLGYSVPSRYGGTEVPVWEFAGWPVHLLGGSPHRQMAIMPYMDVRSMDGNYAQRIAVKLASFWMPGNARWASNRYWPSLREAYKAGLMDIVEVDAPYRAFELSCANIMKAFRPYL